LDSDCDKGGLIEIIFVESRINDGDMFKKNVEKEAYEK
jgi:hypothetical protein